MESSSPVTCKTVKRYYWNGKGYATKRQAYTAKAKRLLWEMVLGPMVEKSLCGNDDGELTVQVLQWIDAQPHLNDESERRARIDKRFAEFFPHDWSETCVQPGCLHEPSADGCRANRNGWGQDAEWDFAFESCKWSQQQWIKAKVAELIAAAEQTEVIPEENVNGD